MMCTQTNGARVCTYKHQSIVWKLLMKSLWCE